MSPVATFLLTLVGLSVAIIGIQALKFTPCGGATVLSVEIPQCKSDPCVLKHEQVIQIKAVMKAKYRSTKIKTSMSGVINDRTMNLPLNDTDVCAANFVQPPCPVVPGRVYTYATDFKVQKFIPVGHIEVTYKGVAERNRVIACAKMNVIVEKN